LSQVVEVLWNLESTILAVWCEKLPPDGSSSSFVPVSYGNKHVVFIVKLVTNSFIPDLGLFLHHFDAVQQCYAALLPHISFRKPHSNLQYAIMPVNVNEQPTICHYACKCKQTPL